MADLRARGVALALPRVTGRAEAMTFHAWASGDALEQAEYGFLQPLPSAPLVEPDGFIVPLLGFDAACNRIGQGAGHYDRYFGMQPNTLKIGLSWSSQKCASLPVADWDVPLDAVLTEKDWHVREGSAMLTG